MANNKAKQVRILLTEPNGKRHWYVEGVEYPDHLAALPQMRRVKNRLLDWLASDPAMAGWTLKISQEKARKAANYNAFSDIYPNVDLGENSHAVGPKTEKTVSKKTKTTDSAGAGIAAILDAAIAKAAENAISEKQVREIVDAALAGREPKVERYEFSDAATFEPTDGEIIHCDTPRLMRLLAAGVTRIGIVGEAGDGKTFAVSQAARFLKDVVHKGQNFGHYQMSPVAESFEAMGHFDANSNYITTQFRRWVDHDGPALLELDELDVSDSNALMSLSSGLGNGVVVFPDGAVEVAENKYVIATMNTPLTGASARYTGRQAQDGAMRDRFSHLIQWSRDAACEAAVAKLRFPYETTEAAIAASVRVRANLENEGVDLNWSPRRTFSMAQSMHAGFSEKEAALMAGVNVLEEVSQTTAMMGLKG